MRMHTLAALTVFGLMGSIGLAGITNLNGDLNLESLIDAQFQGSSFDDKSIANIQINPDKDTGFLFDFTTNRITGVFAGGTGGMVETVSSVVTNTQMYAFSHAMTNTATLGTGMNDYAQSDHSLRLNSFVGFEEGDQVLITMRIEYEAVDDGQLWAEFELEGIDGQGPVRLSVSDPTEAGFVEFSTITTVAGPRAFFLNADIESRVEVFGDDRDVLVDGFSMSASFTLVPAPGGVLVLGGLGVFSARRRR